MKTVNVALGERSYPIYIGDGLLDNPLLLLDSIGNRQVMVITNETIAPLLSGQSDAVSTIFESLIISVS